MQYVLRFNLSVVARNYVYLRREASIYNAALGKKRITTESC